MKQITVRTPNEAEEARKLVCLEQLAQDRQQLLVRWPFIGGVIMRMELIAVRDDRLPTACTDGDNIFVDINFYSKLTKDERLFVLAHEVWHSVLLHFARRQNRDTERFNIAADLEIHFTLKEERMREPFVLPHEEDWDELSAEEIYEKLPKLQKKPSKKGDPSKDSDAPGAFGDGKSSFDKHIYQGDKLPAPSSQNADEGDGSSSEASAQASEGTCPEAGAQASGENCPEAGAQASGNEVVIDRDYNPHVSSEAVERSRSRTIASAQQLERLQGTLPGNLKSLLDKLQKPSLPWQEMLKQFVTTCYGGKRRWLPPARRHVWQDIYLPSMRDEALKAVVALDTSGSTQGDLPVFFGELFSLMKSFGKFELDIIQCDAEIQMVEHYSETNAPPPSRKWKVKGFGGTDFRPVFDYVQKKMHVQPDLLLFFTDGYGGAPTTPPHYPVMWILTENGKQPAAWGRVAHFKKER